MIGLYREMIGSDLLFGGAEHAYLLQEGENIALDRNVLMIPRCLPDASQVSQYPIRYSGIRMK